MREQSKWSKIACALWLGGAIAAAQSGPATNSPSAPMATNAAAADMQFKEVKPGIYELGDVRIDKTNRSVSFPAKFNLAAGPMEYFLVTSWGKIHESILRTETQPYRIHVAMLLLGAKGAGTNAPGADGPPASFVSHPANIKIPGDDITVEISWNVDGKQVRRRAGELIFNRDKNAPMLNEEWVYNGSQMYEDSFIAQGDGSVVSLITDRSAMINNTGPGHDDDSIWTANTNNLPPTNLPLEVTIKLDNSKIQR